MNPTITANAHHADQTIPGVPHLDWMLLSIHREPGLMSNFILTLAKLCRIANSSTSFLLNWLNLLLPNPLLKAYSDCL
ncbi:Uncharacterized protein APZ42_022662 [Daphnia magna]|uniref:Uncharacterized protein n=1 Tax=Daphnia magna TaxID=35525 RepID=A0A164VPW1_9CRUS|nr:Uncharacterized protein APZ42_022662 [Daphnia magna]